MQIQLPDPCLVVLLGVAGAGKSTFARAHFAPTEIVSSDLCRALVCDDESNQTVNNEAFAILHLITASRLHYRKLTVIDATNVQREARTKLLAIARQYQFPAVALVLNFAVEICLQRNAQRRQRVVPPDIVLQQFAELQQALRTLPDEGFQSVSLLASPAEAQAIRIVREREEASGSRNRPPTST